MSFFDLPSDRLRHFGHLDFKSEVLEHFKVAVFFLALRRQVIAHEDAVGGIQAQRLERAEIDFPSSGYADFLSRVKIAEEGKHLQAIARIQFVRAFQLCPVDRMEEVDRN